jgi:hypothetical protein
MKMLIAIDGASDLGETEAAYAIRYADSWSNRLYQRSAERSRYFQAERIVTGDVVNQALEVAGWVFENTSDGDEIAFVGYSRGGAACLIAASILSHSVLFREETRNVVAVGLFDPVANQIAADSRCSNASFSNTSVYLARRSDGLDGVAGFTFPPIEVSVENIPHLQERTFDGMHGDLGGQSSDTSRDAYIWIGDFLEDHGFIHFDSP